MRKIWIAFCLVVLEAAGAVAWAQTGSPSVAVFPFTIRGQEELPRAQQTLRNLLDRNLTEEGLRVVGASEVAGILGGRSAPASESAARAMGGRLKADYVLFGSLNQVGGYISVDARLVDVSGNKRTEVLYAEERGLENLASIGNQIGRQVSVRLLSKAVVTDIQVKGNQRIEPDAILANVKSGKGELLRPEQVSEDIKSIYKMGFFAEVNADAVDNPEGGKTLVFTVRENPTVQEVNIKGNKKLAEKDIMAALATKPHAVLQRNVVNEDAQRILKLYHEKAFFNAEVEPVINFPRDPRNATVTFNIKENQKVYIKEIEFTGNKHFSDRKLRGVMETSEKGWFYWITDHGIFQKDKLDTDLERLNAFYHDEGFMDARIGAPVIDRIGDGFHIKIPVEEGERYKVESVKIAGDVLEDEKQQKEIEKKLQIKSGKYFSREKVREDVETISKAFMNEGYAYPDVNPQVQKSPDETAQITYNVSKGRKYRIGRITITGNTKTQDRVIRRQMAIMEGETFSAAKMEHSSLNLRKLDYFEQAEITPSESSEPDVMNLEVRVKEKLTGSISVGGGYSSEDGPFVGGEIIQRNLFGSGLILGLKAYIGEDNSRYSLSFTEPSIMDTLLSGGFDVYNWEKSYRDFTKDSIGGKLRFGYPFGDWSRLNVSYLYENAKVKDVAENASLIIRDQEGRHQKGSLLINPIRDTTDHPFMPTQGSVNSVTVEIASEYLGGESNYVIMTGESGWFYPLFWKFIGFSRVKGGYIAYSGSESSIPIYDRFFLGGINSIRAFQFGDVGPTDPTTGEVIGGIKYGLFNQELLFPIAEKLGIRGVVFFDAGNAFDEGEAFDITEFRTAAGVGIRWNSPMGPLRVEWGYNLDRRDGEDKYNWQFTMGAFF